MIKILLIAILLVNAFPTENNGVRYSDFDSDTSISSGNCSSEQYVWNKSDIYSYLENFPKLQALTDDIYEHQIEYPCVNARFVIGISVTESTGGNFSYNHNLFGISSNGKAKKFSTDKESLDEFYRICEVYMRKYHIQTVRDFVEMYNSLQSHYLTTLLNNIPISGKVGEMTNEQ